MRAYAEEEKMKKALAIAVLFFSATLSWGAQGKGHQNMPHGNPPAGNSGSMHSNAPTGTPAASADRDTGRERAEDVGSGKKKGVKTPKTKHKAPKHSAKS